MNKKIYLPDGFWIDLILWFIIVGIALLFFYVLLKIFFFRKDLIDQSQLDATTTAYINLVMQELRFNTNSQKYYFLEEISRDEYLENKRKIQMDLNQAEIEYKEATQILHG